MRIEGHLQSWNDERGFGFIEPSNGGQAIFVHIKAFENRQGRPSLGQRLTFEVEIGPDGKKRAKRVQLIQRQQERRKYQNNSPAQWGTASYFAIPLFLVVYVVVAIFWQTPAWMAGLYVVASVVCFIAYAMDKSAAVAGQWRIPEANLIFLGLIGGWPGAIIAQQVLRHKSNKASFRSTFWGSVVANVMGFIAFNSPLVLAIRTGV